MVKDLKFIGIRAAGRKNGNSEIILNELLKPAVEAGYEVEKIDLMKYNLRPCTGCFACNNNELECVIKDDLKLIHKQIAEADAIATVSPCYGMGAPSLLKTVIDRSAIGNMTSIAQNDKKKYGAAVSVGGGDLDWMSLQRIFPSLLLGFYNCNIIGHFNIEKTALKGEILLTPSKLKEVRELGKLLVKSTEEDISFKSKTNNLEDRLVCPNCYSDVFHVDNSKGSIYSTQHYKCAVCNIKIDHYGKIDKLLTSYHENQDKFGKSRFTVDETLSHFDHIGNKIVSGMEYVEEINSRLNGYLNENVVPENDYVPKVVEEEEIKNIAWDSEALNFFKGSVPRIFQGYVKEAVEKKAKKMGVSIITKELFLKIKREAGF